MLEAASLVSCDFTYRHLLYPSTRNECTVESIAAALQVRALKLTQWKLVNMHKTQVILTVDTEPSIAGAMEDLNRYPPLLHEPVWGEVDGDSEALGFITKTLNHFDFKATFFVETVHTKMFGLLPMKQYTDHLLACKQDIQLHIHPVWLNFVNSAHSGKKYNDKSAELDQHDLTELIKESGDIIESWTGKKPVAMRTGNFSASSSVYRAMADAGIYLASNICVACEDYSEKQLQIPGGIQEINGVYEFPASCFIDPGPIGKGRYRAAQITACSAGEIMKILNQCGKRSTDIVVIVTHPFEFIKKSDFRYNKMRANQMVQRRLEKVCSFLYRNQDRFEITTFGALNNFFPPPLAPSPALKTTIINSLARSTTNFINDRI